ncbi:isoleucyl-tRNA synthetase [Hydrogenoanaerobacterium saccharovorans]|uniref:Isoleucine--tRNA ligase n=1 Tax=Hydrogenoanaerobacterium saccharovorans TaxID=474960 RepID=A0A1H7ZJJ6_9FIRM|nr:isoleucine--tRNA ligase [Hydrogenoanaerobacterium saccharovorans]RPF48559.1 isoleucyl-tRNA synthetase [Hydrogenoanaerobacterium saccharovorans]SEM58495.1 Isoleucyl-tRNA synthetase [Hydrogenoanaerobacterium saccharovorans]
MSQDYNQTLNLPKTDFSMRAALPQREPDWLKTWEEDRRYYKMIEKNADKPLYVLHDGPPYANGDIHLGTALNKVLKDIIIRSKNMTGYKAPYIPGWDTHGLPIELKARKKIGGDQTKLSPIELRKHCREFALGYVDQQAESFKRLGSIGDYDHPYLSLQPELEAKQIEIFGEMAKKGYIYKGLKPVYWCPTCNTALAEAEIEYEEDPCHSIYVKFNVVDDKGKFSAMGIDPSNVYFVIWTTTTWTLPGNLAICLGGTYEYSVVKVNDEYYVMATELLASAMAAAKIESYETVGTIPGSDLEHITYKHPFLDRISPIILGDHVTLESGTGCVHTAPGHGVEDFEVCVNHYPDIPIIVPVDSKGVLTEEAGQFAGLSTQDANKAIAQYLDKTGSLFALQKIIHQYPHCWRCHSPILFRATEQWFCSVEDFKEQTIKAIEGVEWIPDWGEGRIINMVRDRSDWCISRQRVWGVPIPIFYCDDCGKYIVNDESIKAVSELFGKEGSDAWYLKSAEEILPDGFTCPHCGGKHFTKEKDIMDVWYDSGITHASVLTERGDLTHWPADLYLEGADQYRGWFQSSLLTAVAWRGAAPYKAVCTHGWVVDGEGKKQSKSLGNGILPEEIIKEYGADILRLWVASSDYHADVRISKEILKQLSEQYRKIRNTARYILGNVYDFDPDTDSIAFADMVELDKWAIVKLNELTEKVKEAYNKFDFHVAFHAVHNFCTIDMSNFYLDVIKDRLYCEAATDTKRRSAQTAIYTVLSGLTRLVSPIIPFTAEEIWASTKHGKDEDGASIIFNQMPNHYDVDVTEAFMEKWNRIHIIRDDVNKALEQKRNAKQIGKSLEAKVILHSDAEMYEFLTSVKEELATAFIVSEVELVQDEKGEYASEIEGLKISVVPAEGEKCERCWIYSDTVGKCSDHPTLCARCASVLK